jgi:hypothetical protein
MPSDPAAVGFEELTARLGAAPADLWSLYLRLLPAEFFAQVREQDKLRHQNNRVYTDRVVIWLMILQRLSGGTMETAVLELLRTLPAEFWPQPCTRLQARLKDSKAKLSQQHGIVQSSASRITLNDRGTRCGSGVPATDRTIQQTDDGQAGCVFCGWLHDAYAPQP